MDLTPWPVAQDGDRLVQARFELHSLVQWLARVQASYQDRKEKATSLHWLAVRGAITTGALVGTLTLELRLPSMTLQFLDDGMPVNHPLDTEDHSPAQVEAWILVELLHRGVDRTRFSKALAYDTSFLLSGDATKFSPEVHGEELAVLAGWISLAAEEIARCRGADLVLVRPQDLSLEAAVGNGRVVGFTAGAGQDEPHFFVRRGGTTRTLAASAVGAAGEGRIEAFLAQG